MGWRRTARPKGSQKPNQQISTKHEQRFSLILSGSGCGVRPGHQRCPAAGPAVRRTAKARSTARPKSKPRARPGAARKPATVFEPEEQAQPNPRPKAKPSSPSSVGLTAAPLSLRHVYRRPRQFLPDWPSANRQNMSFKRAGAPKGRFTGRFYLILFSRALRDSSIFG